MYKNANICNFFPLRYLINFKSQNFNISTFHNIRLLDDGEPSHLYTGPSHHMDGTFGNNRNKCGGPITGPTD